jgi:cobalt/nickel transport system permease protein
MTDISARVRELHAIDDLAGGDTAIHRLHPLAKLISALAFIVAVVSFGRYDVLRLAPYFFYPFIFMALSGIPYSVLLKRLLIALPFCLFAGISNVIFDRDAAFYALGVPVSFGALSLCTILAKMYLCVMAGLLLVATTPFTRISAQLRRLRVPYVFVLSFEMIYRYIGVLMDEVHSMTTAYLLRSAGKKALELRHIGSFLGMLLLRGFDRAERVYAAMQCRGYSLREIPKASQPLRRGDAITLVAVCAPSLVLRFVKIL